MQEQSQYPQQNELVTLITEKGCSGVTFESEWYPAVNDRVRVPARAVAELTRPIHRNRLATEADDAKPATLAQTLHIKQGKRA